MPEFQPSSQETLDLIHTGHNKTDEVAITTLDFPDNETTTFWVGTEEGNVYQANRYDRAGSKAGLNQHDVYRGHAGPVMALNFHPLVGPIDFSDLFLTCSVDWTVKLWRAKSMAKPSTTHTVISPIYSFDEADDYVYDVKWHPAHPAVFGTADGSGKFDLWNLNVDTEVRSFKTRLLSLFIIFSRFLLSRRWSVLGVRLTSWNGIGKMADGLLWAPVMGNCTSTTWVTLRSPGSPSGQTCSGQYRVWLVLGKAPEWTRRLLPESWLVGDLAFIIFTLCFAHAQYSTHSGRLQRIFEKL